MLYLPGGVFIHNISKAHWNLIFALMRITNATFIVPDLPLAPFQTANDAFKMLEHLYMNILSQTDADSIILMGDSSGGGLAFSFVQKLKKENKEQPKQLIMISPWLNIANSNVDSVILEKDAMLEPKAPHEVGKWWAGKLGTKNYLVSPIFGDFTDLCTITVFTGGHDILFSQAQKLKYLMKQKNIPLNYFEYPKMFHIWWPQPS